MTSQHIGTANGHRRATPQWEGWQPINLGLQAGVPGPEPVVDPPPVNEPPAPAYDPVAMAEADRIRTLAEAEAEARRIEAESAARAAEIQAVEEARKQKIANDRAERRAGEDQAASEARIAESQRKKAEAERATQQADQQAREEAAREAKRAVEQQRSEWYWKWGARGIYLVGLVIAAPVQFLHFWDPKRPFLIAAPALLEGFALVLAAGAAWAVAHRRDVAPYRVGIMLGAIIAAGINLYGGLYDPAIGFNAGLIGAISSLGGPIVLMAYEHGIAQKADGIPSWRERRATSKKIAEEKASRERARREREDAARKAADEKADKEAAAEAEQRRKDADRQENHQDVWEVAYALRSARGSAVVTEAIWLEAWHLVTGSKQVGIRPEIEAASKAAQARMKAASEDHPAQVESQMPPTSRRDPDAPDRRMFNGGTPPTRTPGDTQQYHAAARAAAAETARQHNAQKDS